MPSSNPADLWLLDLQKNGYRLTESRRAVVEVIDLRYSPQAAMQYGIKLIPTQVFFDKKGVEVYRHEGFMPKDQIVAKFQELGAEPK